MMEEENRKAIAENSDETTGRTLKPAAVVDVPLMTRSERNEKSREEGDGGESEEVSLADRSLSEIVEVMGEAAAEMIASKDVIAAALRNSTDEFAGMGQSEVRDRIQSVQILDDCPFDLPDELEGKSVAVSILAEVEMPDERTALVSMNLVI